MYVNEYRTVTWRNYVPAPSTSSCHAPNTRMNCRTTLLVGNFRSWISEIDENCSLKTALFPIHSAKKNKYGSRDLPNGSTVAQDYSSIFVQITEDEEEQREERRKGKKGTRKGSFRSESELVLFPYLPSLPSWCRYSIFFLCGGFSLVILTKSYNWYASYSCWFRHLRFYPGVLISSRFVVFLSELNVQNGPDA